jgi:hypothetical protein
MKKRALAAVLWFYAAWTFGSMLAWMMGLSIPLGPVLAVAAAAVILRVPQLTSSRSAQQLTSAQSGPQMKATHSPSA